MDKIEIISFTYFCTTLLCGVVGFCVVIFKFLENYSYSAVTARTFYVLKIFYLKCNEDPFPGRTKQSESPLTTLDFLFTPFSC